MCTLALAYKVHKNYPLIFIGNRDEFFMRPTKDASIYEGIISGIDLEKGGTWTGITELGRFACLTNYRDFSKHIKEPKSRGHLVSNFLTSDMSPQVYLDQISKSKSDYNPYNLIFGTMEDLRYYSNISDKGIALSPGIYGLSNALLDTPWPKVVKIKREFQERLASIQIIEPDNINAFSESLFQILENREIAQDHLLPSTGIDRDLEKSLSSLFIELDTYGTRYETVIMVDHQGEINYFEKARQLNNHWNLQRLKLKIK